MSQDRAQATAYVNATLILTAVFATSAAEAQETAAADSLDTVVVTGRAGVEEAQKVELSYALTTISADSLRREAPNGVADALKSVPGFWVESSGGEASANIRARGIPQEGFSAVGMQEDGLPIQHDPGLGWLNGDQSFRLDETVERIEVVRGGPASMFASNAPGGIVNFITRRPSDVAKGLVKLETSDYGMMRADAWYGGPIGDWRFGAGGFFRKDDGVRDAGYTANEGGQVRLALGRDFEGGSLDFNVKRIDDNVIFYTGLPLTNDANGDITGVPGVDALNGTLAGPETERVRLRNAAGPFDLDLGAGTDVKLTQFTANLQYDLPGEWRLQNGLRYRESESSRSGLFPNTPVSAQARLAQYRNDYLARFPGATDIQLRYVTASNEVFNPVNQNGNGLIEDGALRQVSVPLDELVDDIRFMRNVTLGGQRHDIAVGAYFAKVDETFQRYSANSLTDVRDNARLLNAVAVDAAGNALGVITDNGITRYGSEFANGEGDSKTYALYLSDEWQITEPLRVDLGARWEKVSVQGAVERFAPQDLGDTTIADDAILSGTGVFDAFDRDFADFGWTAGANYQFNSSSGVFARYTSTFRLPSVGSFITNPTARPATQTMDFIEAGYKFSRNNLSVYATAFDTRFDTFEFTDLAFNPATGGFDSRTAYTDTKTAGIELEVRYAPVAWFDVRASGTYQDPKFGDFVTQQNVGGQLVTFDFSDNRLQRIPKVSYRLTPALNFLGDRGRVELDYEHYGDRFSDLANSLVLPEYDVLNANASFQLTKQIQFFVRGENLTDEVGLTEGNPRAGQFTTGQPNSPFFVGRPIYGRNYSLSFMWSY
jgi:catecholate siderophore receptor